MAWFIMHASHPPNASAVSTFQPDPPPVTPPSSVPAWLESMTPATWDTIAGPGGRIFDVLPADPGPGIGPAAITSAWNGGAVDQSTGRMIISNAGGHGDRAHNDIYVLDLTANAPAWARIRDPSAATGGEEADNSLASFGDGQPRAAHTYARPAAGGGRVYHLGIDAMFGAAGFSSAATYSAPVTGSGVAWTYHGNPLADAEGIDKRWLGGGGAFDPTTGHLWATGQGGVGKRMVRYDPAGDAFTLFNPPSTSIGYNWICVADERRLLIVGGVLGLWYCDLSTGVDEGTATLTWAQATLSGSPSIIGQQIAAQYHHPSRALFAWNGDGADVRSCAVPATLTNAWAQSLVSPLSGNSVTPSAKQLAGTWGRFNIVRDIAGSGVDAFVLLNDIDESTYVMRIPEGGL